MSKKVIATINLPEMGLNNHIIEAESEEELIEKLDLLDNENSKEEDL